MNKIFFTLSVFALGFSCLGLNAQDLSNQFSPVYSFTENKGQLLNDSYNAANDILYYSNMGNIAIYIGRNKLFYVIKKNNKSVVFTDENDEMPSESGNSETVRIELKLVNSNLNSTIKGEEKCDLLSNYFLPGNPKGISAQNFKKVKIENVYNGIDWIIYFKEINGRTVLKYDFEVRPGADFTLIKMLYDGADRIYQSDKGGINIDTKLGNIQDGKPVTYLSGSKQKIKSSFKLVKNEIGFIVNNYDKSEKIIIDPTVLWSTYFGYNGDEHGRAVAVGADGFIYTGGFTNSTNFPLLNGYSSPLHDAFDGWVMKLTPNFQPLWITYYGGTLADVCRTIDVDSAGNVFVGMETRSGDMPTFNAYQPAKSDTDDFFIMKLNPSGIPIWATYYGGNNLDALRRIKLSHSGFLVASGYSRSTNFPMVNPIQANNAGDADAIIMKISMNTGFPIWSTYYGGSLYDEPVGITLDNNNNIYLVGTTFSSNFPVLNAYQSVLKGISDIFILKLNSNMTTAWSTFFGCTLDDDGNGIAIDNNGNSFIIGTTKKNNFPVLNAWLPIYKGPSDAIVSKFSPTGGLIWSTFVGGQGTDDGNSIAVDNIGNVVATGYTLSATFPMVNPIQSTFGGVHDAYIVRFSNNGTCLMSTYYGGNGIEHARSITVDNNGSTYVVGSTESTNLLLVNPIQSSNGSVGNFDADCFMLKLNYSIYSKPVISVFGQVPKCNSSDVIQLASSNSIGNIWSNGLLTQLINTNQTGNFFVTAMDSTGVGINSDTISITNNPLAFTSLDSIAISGICPSTTLNLTAQNISGATYLWSGPNGFNSTLINPVINNIQQINIGIYVCTATINSCVKIINKVNLLNIINQGAPANSTYSGPVCQGGQFTLSTDSVNGAQYLWSGPAGFLSTARITTITNAQLSTNGNYFIKLIFNGCESLPDTVAVVVANSPIANAGADQIACNGNNNINLDGINDASATGTWTSTTVPHAIIQNPNNPNSLATNLKIGTNQFKWTLTNGICTPVYDLAIVKYTTAANFGCIKPSNLNHVLTGNSATLNWSTCTIADQFQVRITLNSTSYNIFTNNYTVVLNNLAPGTYYWKVKPKCSGVWSSTFSITKSFVIVASPKYEPVVLPENIKLNLYPNPVSNQLNVAFELKTAGTYKIEMLDVLGRILISESNEFDDGNWQLNYFTGNLSAGVYFMRLTGIENTNLTARFIKE